MMTISLKRKNLSIICILLILVFICFQPASSFATDSKTCTTYRVPVALTEGAPASYHVSGTLCSQGDPHGKTVQVLVHGGTLTHEYWDFSYQPEKYSYVNALTKSGYVTFNIDRIGVANSDRPPSLEVTIASNAYVVHQIIQKLRSGDIGGIPFSKVILVGHSYGSIVSVVSTGKYNDVDGLIITGLLNPTNALKLALLIKQMTPAQLDPVLKDNNFPLGYFTLPKNAREIFYNLDNVDPKVLDIDNETKGTVTDGELATLEDLLIPSSASKIKVPILFAVGEKDKIFCGGLLTSCSSPATIIAREKPYYTNAPNLEAYILASAGHNMNYERDAQDLYKAIQDWSDRHIGKN